MIKLILEETSTNRMNNLDITNLEYILNSKEFEDFILDLYSDDIDNLNYLLVSVDICDAINRLTPRSAVAEPIHTTDNIVFRIFDNIFQILEEPYEIDEEVSGLTLTPSIDSFKIFEFLNKRL